MVSARQSVFLKCILWVIPQIPQESFHSVSQLETLSTNSNYMQFILSYIIYHHIYFSSSSSFSSLAPGGSGLLSRFSHR